MKCLGIFVLVVTAVVMQDVLTQNLFGSDVQIGLLQSPVKNIALSGNDAKVVLQNGYTKFQDTLKVAESKAIEGLTHAAQLVITDPKTSAETIRKCMQEASDTHYDAGLSFFFGIGGAVSICNSAREKLSEASLLLQYGALEVLDEMGTSLTLALQGTELGGNLGKQAIEAACLAIRASFAQLYYQIPISFKIAVSSVSDLQNCHPGTGRTTSKNLAINNVIPASISVIEKVAEDAIQNKGASIAKVNWLKESLKITLADLADVTLKENESFAYIQLLAKTDPSLAKDKYLTDTKDFVRRIHIIFANTFLDYAASAVNYDSSVMKEIGSAIRILERANGDVIVAEGISKHMTLVGLASPDDNVRLELLEAALNTLNFKMETLARGILTSAKIMLGCLK